MGSSKRQDVCALKKPCLHSFTSHPSPHPCHASPLHLKHPERNATFMFHSSSLCLLLLHSVFHFGGFCCYMFPSLSLPVCLVCCFVFKKKKLFFLVAVRQSVCLSVFVHVAVFLAVWPQVEKWGHPVGGLIRRIPEG